MTSPLAVWRMARGLSVHDFAAVVAREGGTQQIWMQIIAAVEAGTIRTTHRYIHPLWRAVTHIGDDSETLMLAQAQWRESRRIGAAR